MGLERLEEARGTGGKSRKEHGPAGAVTLAAETRAGLLTHRTVRCVFQATAGGHLHSSSRKLMPSAPNSEFPIPILHHVQSSQRNALHGPETLPELRRDLSTPHGSTHILFSPLRLRWPALNAGSEHHSVHTL